MCTNAPVVQPIQKALRRMFSASFDVWEVGEPWSQIADGGEHSASGSIVPPGVLNELLNRCLQLSDPCHSYVIDEHYALLAIPFPQPESSPLVATAVIPGRSHELLKKLAAAALDLMSYWTELEQHEQDLTAYAEQVSQDFEELSWLRELAKHLEYCEVGNSLESLIQGTFPELQRIVGAAAVVFIQPAATANGEPLSLEPLAWTGDRTVSVDTCCKLVQKFHLQARKQPVVLNYVQQRADADELPGVQSVIIVSLMHRGRCQGWLMALNRLVIPRLSETAPNDGTDEFGTVEAGLLLSASTLLATHSRNLQMFREQELLLLGTIRALINTVDAKDPYTCGHSDRVALIAKRLGAQLKLDNQECERLYMAGLLHDIGKIGVPDEVLTKPGRLTDEEFELIKRHPVIGYEILRHLDRLSHVLPGVLHHHESWDGHGYPRAMMRGDNVNFF